jgi:rRNA small subunit pseudouridine methyltransferase Nep1
LLSLVIAESALELVPLDLQIHNSIIASARKFDKKTSEVLLDTSWHFAATRGIKNETKRGRPDLVHFCLLEACSIPLYFENKLKVFVHTIDDRVIFVGQNVRLPRSYHRFAGLVEKLYLSKKIEEGNNILLEIKSMRFGDLIKKINPKQTVALSSKGTKSSYEKVAAEIHNDTCLVIGGYPKGQFSDKIVNHFDKVVSVDKNPLDAHIIISRILYEYEKRIIT